MLDSRWAMLAHLSNMHKQHLHTPQPRSIRQFNTKPKLALCMRSNRDQELRPILDVLLVLSRETHFACICKVLGCADTANVRFGLLNVVEVLGVGVDEAFGSGDGCGDDGWGGLVGMLGLGEGGGDGDL